MNTMTTDETYELYAAWNADRRSDQPTPLKQWIARYPAYADELIQWTANAPLVEAAETLPADPQGEERALKTGRMALAEVRARYEAASAAPLNSLIETAKAKGWTLKALTETLQVGRTTLAKLEQRLFQVATIPAQLIDGLAESLQVNAAQEKNYLNQSPTLASSASYKSTNPNQPPSVSEQEDFAQAVRECRDMTPEQKAHWLHGEK